MKFHRCDRFQAVFVLLFAYFIDFVFSSKPKVAAIIDKYVGNSLTDLPFEEDTADDLWTIMRFEADTLIEFLLEAYPSLSRRERQRILGQYAGRESRKNVQSILLTSLIKTELTDICYFLLNSHILSIIPSHHLRNLWEDSEPMTGCIGSPDKDGQRGLESRIKLVYDIIRNQEDEYETAPLMALLFLHVQRLELLSESRVINLLVPRLLDGPLNVDSIHLLSSFETISTCIFSLTESSLTEKAFLFYLLTRSFSLNELLEYIPKDSRIARLDPIQASLFLAPILFRGINDHDQIAQALNLDRKDEEIERFAQAALKIALQFSDHFDPQINSDI